MVNRFHISKAQEAALRLLADKDWPVTARQIKVRHHILVGCQDRGLAGSLEDPSVVGDPAYTVRWHITPAGREFLKTGKWKRDEDKDA